MEYSDMPKLECPFVRKEINGRYLITKDVTPGMDWVFDDTSVIATEKLDGTNVSIVIERGIVIRIYNRKNLVMANGLRIENNKGTRYILDGVLEAIEKGYVSNLSDGQHFGEVIGPKFGRVRAGGPNPYLLDKHIWIPFNTYVREHLKYKSWGKYPKDFETISRWFKDDLLPLYFMRIHGQENIDKKYVEGIVFHHLDGRMAKIRKDMFDFYEGTSHGD